MENANAQIQQLDYLNLITKSVVWLAQLLHKLLLIQIANAEQDMFKI